MAQFQNVVNELIDTLDDLRDNKEIIKAEIFKEENEKQEIEQELEILSERLDRINGKYLFNFLETIMRAATEKKELERTIADTEHTKNKIVESFKTLL